MKNLLKNKNLIFSLLSLGLFVVFALLYSSPVFQDKTLIQHDIVQYKGGAKELLDHRAEYGKETYWSNSMFGGMPTYQMGSQFRGDFIKQIDNILNFLPRPANYLFLLFVGFFFLGMVAVRNWKYALLGTSFFGLSTYFYIIIGAGHNGKVHTIAYFAPLLAGILLVYIRRKYFLGFVVSTLFMGLQIVANHFQMTYYLFIALGFLFLSELVRTIIKKGDWKHFGISSGILAVAFSLGIGMNSQRILANMEYVKETVRGKHILKNDAENQSKEGMDKEAMLLWSYGKLETLNLVIPRLYGGASQEEGADRIMQNVQELVQENATSQEEVNNIVRGFSSPTYWGEQPGTSGPAYQGAVVCFLALLGFFFASKKYRYWILGASALTIMLAWGSNFLLLTEFFIDFVPLYNKFRAPSSILVIPELLFPLIAIVGLYAFINNENLTTEYKQKVLYYFGGGVLLLFIGFWLGGKSIFDFHTENEKIYFPPYLLDYLIGERWAMFRADVGKAIVFIGITWAVLLLILKNKINANVALLVIGLVSFFDLWSVNRRYLNDENFADKTLVQNPFITEVSEDLVENAETNTEVQRALSQVKLNQTLSLLAEKDREHYRIFNSVLSPFNETTTSYFKSSVGGYHAAKLRRYDDVISEYFSATDSVKTPKILNMLNVKYLLTGSLEEPQVQINPNANGNAWLVSDIKFVETPNEEIKAIGEIDNKKTAVVLAEDKAYFNGKTLEEDSTATIELTQYKADELHFKTQSKTPQLAVFSEVYYPYGWKVFLDEKEVPYIKANYFLRAVHIPAGNHQIKMIFQPEVIEKGKNMSMTMWGIFLLLAGLGFRYSKKHSQ
ncbi:MAG: YfhO family protein [Flavobacteriaceae bacterium]|nr:YfhO family protein [Flavobacteriaceae bacterium]